MKITLQILGEAHDGRGNISASEGADENGVYFSPIDWAWHFGIRSCATLAEADGLARAEASRAKGPALVVSIVDRDSIEAQPAKSTLPVVNLNGRAIGSRS